MSVTMSKGLLIRIPEPLYRRLKKLCDSEYKSMSAVVRELLKERVDEMLTSEDWDDIHEARKEFKAGKTVVWRSVKRA